VRIQLSGERRTSNNVKTMPQAVDSRTRKPKWRSVQLRELIGTEARAHQSRLIVLGGVDQHMPDFVREHASERAAQIERRHASGPGCAARSVGQHFRHSIE
jgi:hypothetical protein